MKRNAPTRIHNRLAEPPADRTRTERLNVRFTPSELDRINTAAKLERRGLSDWVRITLNDAANEKINSVQNPD